jgi:general secretion pathway protein I
MAVVLAALLAAGSTAARRLAEAEAIAFASLSAQSLLAAAGIEAPLAPGTRQGVLAHGFTWTETVAPMPQQPRAAAVTVVVRDAAGRPRATLVTVRLAPP